MTNAQNPNAEGFADTLKSFQENNKSRDINEEPGLRGTSDAGVTMHFRSSVASR